jgi:hypothetical protein
MYVQARSALLGKDINLGEQNARKSRPLFLPFVGWFNAMEFDDGEAVELDAILSHVVYGLLREDLIEDEFRYGSGDSLPGGKDFGEGGLIYRITPLGVELCCAAHGIRSHLRRAFLDPAVSFEIATPIEMAGQFGLVADMPPRAQTN